MDLLSVVAHEIGLHLGFGEDDSTPVMAMNLPAGVRHVPQPQVTLPGTVAPPQTIVPVANIKPVVAPPVDAPLAPVATSIPSSPQPAADESIPFMRASHAKRVRRGELAVPVDQSASNVGRLIHQVDARRQGQSKESLPLHDLALEKLMDQ
jgi:hypothetical protein